MATQHKKHESYGLETKRINFAECKLAASESQDVMEFSGYGAVFNNLDSYGDVIAPGAFSQYLDDVKSGKQNWPAMLMQHGGWGVTSEDLTPVGVYTDLKEDDFGLKTAGNLAATPRGIEAHTLMKMTPRPAISGLSIGYYVRKESYGGKNDLFDRKLEQIDLVEVSIVTFPANDKARVANVKSGEDFDERKFELFLRDSGFSKKEAQTIVSRGFKALKNVSDSRSDELKQVAALIERNAMIFKI